MITAINEHIHHLTWPSLQVYVGMVIILKIYLLS